MNKLKIDRVTIVSVGAMILGGLATLLGNWGSEQEMKKTVREEVERILAEQEEEES